MSIRSLSMHRHSLQRPPPPRRCRFHSPSIRATSLGSLHLWILEASLTWINQLSIRCSRRSSDRRSANSHQKLLLVVRQRRSRLYITSPARPVRCLNPLPFAGRVLQIHTLRCGASADQSHLKATATTYHECIHNTFSALLNKRLWHSPRILLRGDTIRMPTLLLAALPRHLCLLGTRLRCYRLPHLAQTRS